MTNLCVFRVITAPKMSFSRWKDKL
jgi:hypothetical protein